MTTKKQRVTNRECSMSRVMEVVGDRWSILILREAYYGNTRFDQFARYVGAAPNILSNRLKKLVEAQVLAKVPAPEHTGRFQYVLTDRGRDFFPAYLSLKRWGDDWLASSKGPQVVFRDKATGRELRHTKVVSPTGEPVHLEDIEVVPGSGAVPSARKRFGQSSATTVANKSGSGARRR